MQGVLRWISSKLIGFVARSWRLSGEPLPREAVLYTSWHADLPAASALLRTTKPMAMVSASRDGHSLGAMYTSIGWPVVYGSTHRNQCAVRHLLRHLHSGGSAAMALDGPRGPAGVEQPGAAWLIRHSKRKAVRLEFFYSASIRLRTWDRMHLPLPGSRIVYRWSYL